MRSRPGTRWKALAVLALVALVLVAAGFANAGPAQAPQVDRTRLQADIDSVNGKIRDLEARETRATRVKDYLNMLANDPSVVVMRARDFDGWVPMPAKKLEEFFEASLFLWSLADRDGTVAPPLLSQLAEASDRHKERIRTNELPALDRRIADLARQRAALEQERGRLLAAFTRPKELGPAPPPPPPRNVDLWGTWKPEAGGADVATITGDRTGYTVTGTSGRAKHEGTITSNDGTKYEGDFVDVPGACCGREGHVWIEVVDANTYRARSTWWRTGQTTRQNPEITTGWSTWKRSTK